MKRCGSLMASGLLLGFGLLMLFHESLRTRADRIPVDEGDSRFNHYLLEHSYRWITGEPNHRDLFSPPIFHPATDTLALSDAMVAYAWWYWPLRAVGCPPDTSFVLWMAIASAMNFVAMRMMLTRQFGIAPLPASLGAFLFAFGIPRTAQLGHQQLLPQLYMLAILSSLVWLLQHGRSASPRERILAWSVVVLGGVLQFYAGYYHLWFALFCLAILAAAAQPWPETRADLRCMLGRPAIPAALVALGFAALWPLLHRYLGVLDDVGPRAMSTVYEMLPRPFSWLNTGEGHWLYGTWMQDIPAFKTLPFPGEHVLGIGPLTTALVAAGLFGWWRKAWGRTALLAIVTLLAVTLHVSPAWNPWNLVASLVPGSGAIRAVTRIVLPLLIPASIALALCFQRIRNRWVFAALALCFIAEQGTTVATYDASAVRERTTWLADQAATRPEPFFYLHRINANDHDRYTGTEYIAHLDAMWAGLDASRPTVNGYSGNAPADWIRLYFNSSRNESDEALLSGYVRSWLKQHGGNTNGIHLISDPPTP
jgi:hypothetical protein